MQFKGPLNIFSDGKKLLLVNGDDKQIFLDEFQLIGYSVDFPSDCSHINVNFDILAGKVHMEENLDNDYRFVDDMSIRDLLNIISQKIKNR